MAPHTPYIEASVVCDLVHMLWSLLESIGATWILPYLLMLPRFLLILPDVELGREQSTAIDQVLSVHESQGPHHHRADQVFRSSDVVAAEAPVFNIYSEHPPLLHIFQ